MNTPTPNAMPQRKPQHTWTPPQGTPAPVTPPAPQAGTDNAARRRARRNGWTQEGTD